jgi:hypothetical protein
VRPPTANARIFTRLRQFCPDRDTRLRVGPGDGSDLAGSARLQGVVDDHLEEVRQLVCREVLEDVAGDVLG